MLAGAAWALQFRYGQGIKSERQGMWGSYLAATFSFWPCSVKLHILLDAEGVLLLEGGEVAEGH